MTAGARKWISVGLVAAAVVALGLLALWLVPDRARPRAVGHSAAAGATAVPGRSTAAGLPGAGAAVGGVRVAGRVLLDGAPAVGADVALAQDGAGAGPSQPRAVRSGAGGRFDFGPVPVARYLVSATEAGQTAARLVVDLRDPTRTPPADQLELALTSCTSSVTGVIADASGGAVAGATVTRSERLAGPSTSSDGGGHYQICVPSGTVFLRVDADGYGAVVVMLEVAGHIRHDIALTPEAIISGLVVRAADGLPVAGARVVREPSEGRGLLQPARAWTVSDSEGRFRMAGVSAGTHRLSASADGLATREPVEVTVEAGQTSAVVCRLVAASRLTGTVVEHERPVAGMRVSAGVWSTPRWSDDAVTALDGSFVLEHVPAGVVGFTVEDHDVVTPKSYRGVGPVRIEVASQASISGTVVQHGQPVGFADITVGGAEWRLAAADGEGRFAVRGLGPGSYRVWAGSDAVAAYGQSDPVALARGEHKQGVVVTLDLAGRVSGVVVDQHGAPVRGVVVKLTRTHGSDDGRGTSDDDGHFQIDKLLGGDDYWVELAPTASAALHFHPAGGAFPPVPVPDRAARVTGVRLVIERDDGTIAGTVVDDGGAARADVRVLAAPAGGEAGFAAPGLAAAISAVDGSFHFSDLPGGSYALRARAPDGASATQLAVATGRRDVVLTLAAAGRIAGRLVGFTQPPDVRALRTDRSGSALRAAVVGDTFTLGNLSEGRYLVSAAGDAEAAEAEVDVAAGQTASVTLRGPGSSARDAIVRDFASGTPIPELRCQLALARGLERSPQVLGAEAWSDGGGHFTLTAPALPLYAVCWGNGQYSDATALVPASGPIELWSVRRADDGRPPGVLGAWFDYGLVLVGRIARVRPGGPFERAGVMVGDVIISVNGAAVGQLGEAAVELLVRNAGADGQLVLGLSRGGKSVTARATLDAM